MTANIPGILFVLRGRPGLGHVMPGLALAQRARQAGARVEIVTYAAGSVFLSGQDEISWTEARVREQYAEWPGIDLYENGVREIAQAAERINAHMIVLGGEYMAAPLGRALGVRSAMLYNPEVFDRVERNRIPGRLIATLFEMCDLLIPLAPPTGNPKVPAYDAISHKVVQHGPFFSPDRRSGASKEGVVVIANGGGTFFPKRAASYSSATLDIEEWHSQTRSFTDAAVATAIALSPSPCRVVVYSGMSETDNRTLSHKYASIPCVEIRPVSPSYYSDLVDANLIVSRCGMGFLADLDWLSTPAVVWPLLAHDEQRQNAARVRAERPRTWMAEDIASLGLAMEAAWPGGNAVRETVTPPRDNGDQVVAQILALASIGARL